MGPRCIISYTAILVQCHFRSKQFVPYTFRLDSMECTYNEPRVMCIIGKIKKAWQTLTYIAFNGTPSRVLRVIGYGIRLG